MSEWIAYYLALGVDTILIYDNGSIDATTSVVRAASHDADIRLMRWTRGGGAAQMQAYNHAMETNAREFDWVLTVDSDEYLVVHRPFTLRTLCAAATEADAIVINWAIFGSNGHVDFPDSLVIEAFTRRSSLAMLPNRHVKSIVRPAAVASWSNPHVARVHGRTIRPDGREPVWHDDNGTPVHGLLADAPDFQIAQVNHYFTRSRAHWALKTKRGYPNPQSISKLGHFDLYDRNEIEDLSALWALPTVKCLRARILARTRWADHNRGLDPAAAIYGRPPVSPAASGRLTPG